MLPYLIIGGIAGAICAAVASSKGRSAVGYFFFGFLLPLPGIIVSLVVSNLKEEERRRAHDAAERRRLREQLQQERMKTEALRRHAVSRLDTHDKALGMDTRDQVPLEAGTGFAALPGGAAQPPPASDARWHYVVEGEPRGPVSREDLVDLLRNGTLEDGALVWTPGMTAWTPAGQVGDLSS